MKTRAGTDATTVLLAAGRCVNEERGTRHSHGLMENGTEAGGDRLCAGRIVNEAVLMFPLRGQTPGIENTASLSPSLTPEDFKGFNCFVPLTRQVIWD